MKRVLLTRTHEKMTNGILNRRAMEIANEIDCNYVDLEPGSEPDNRAWVFRFFETADDKNTMPQLVLEVLGTRGGVYTALGNYLAGLKCDI